MTIQRADNLVYEGQAYPNWDFPLELYYEDRPRPAFGYQHSGQWRGYKATWEIEGDTLYLTDIETEWPGRTGLGLAELFPNRGEKVEASWFSGKIHLYGGSGRKEPTRPAVREPKAPHHERKAPHHKRDRILTFRSGKLIGSELVDRRASP
jgi:hypothetical protein